MKINYSCVIINDKGRCFTRGEIISVWNDRFELSSSESFTLDHWISKSWIENKQQSSCFAEL